MVWPLVFLAAGGAAYAVRGAFRLASRTRLGASGSSHGASQGVPLGTPAWLEGVLKKAGDLRHQVEHLTRDMKGFETPMTRSEAYQILKLGPAASKEKILQTHKQLMLRNHPDNGGSTYVAAKVNEAKDKLLRG
ncbi:mitochondrial import inner membrane translocase subunit TIM14 [Cyclospora cayetanensis]|uniref:Uncharacterized protein n=2 Tax=Cyclospora cayetanensis TaxID=88456 RepID=A0A1D3D5H5_9EIME|nr:mitochondrial import inner membrane translocase subunit TIM14 [Cyclospora cayetanensis]OEH78701.1 hypothetical protein cyc_03067 [Cyclospora cayetanensis]